MRVRQDLPVEITSTGTRTRLPAVAVLLYCVALATVSLVPGRQWSALAATPLGRTLNNLLHVPAYGGLAWLCAGVFAAYAGPWHRTRAILAGAAAAIAFGALLELAQGIVPGRQGTVADMLLNAAGAAAAAVVIAAQPGIILSKRTCNDRQARRAARKG